MSSTINLSHLANLGIGSRVRLSQDNAACLVRMTKCRPNRYCLDSFILSTMASNSFLVVSHFSSLQLSVRDAKAMRRSVPS